MSFNFSVTDMKNELAKGVTMDELAKAMTDALNEAQKQYNAEEAWRKEVEAQKERESKLAKARMDVTDAFYRYMKLAMPELNAVCDDEDWKELSGILDQQFTELEAYFKVIAPLLGLSESTEKENKSNVDVPSDAITRFLFENGLK